MKKNFSSININSPSFLSIKGLNSPQNMNINKVEGVDKLSTGLSFKQKIQQIKKKPKKQSLEDAYVTGLQDQIHYLQLQLKLLKQKQIAKHSQVDQLETFFGDGIPINQNILALKNGFNSYKAQIEKKINNLQTQKKERQNIIQSLSVQVSQTTKNIHDKQKEFKQNLTQRSNITHDKVKKQTLIKQQLQMEEQNMRIIKTQNRTLMESLCNMQRAKQLVCVALLRNQNNKHSKLNKLKESIAEKQKQVQEVGKAYEDLKKQEDDQTYVLKVQENNIKVKRKIISLDKQLNNLTTKIQQKKMDLQAKLKQRHKQIVGRMDMQNRLNATKQAIEKWNNMSVEQLERICQEKVLKILQKMFEKNKKLTKYYDYYSNLQFKVEQHIYQIGQKKPQLKQQLQIIQNDITHLTKQLQKQKTHQCNLKSQLSALKSKQSHILQITPPMIQQIKHEQEKIKMYKIQKQRLVQQIKIKEKQLELIQILKCVNLEQTQIASCSNSSIQDQLMDFMKNWEMLNRN